MENTAINQPLTTTVTSSVSPDLLEDSVESRIVRIRPAATPVDQITRCIGHRKVSSMKVDFYSVDIKPGEDAVKTAVAKNTSPSDPELVLEMESDNLFAPTDTVMIPSIKRDGTDPSKGSLTGYVSKTDGNRITVHLEDFIIDDAGRPALPAIPAGTRVVRMGRAASELDVMTGLYNSLPVKDFNFCQIFKAQVENSTMQSLARKEVGWTFRDQEEVAVIDMRLGMEKTFLFGHRERFEDPDTGSEVFLTGGIWNQAGRDYSFGGKVDITSLTALMRRAFTGSGGSRAKVLIAGSGLVEKLSCLDYTRTVSSTGKSTHWGIDFDTIVSKFGTLNVVHSEIFDLCGHENDGLVLDPEYVTKYTHIPFNAQTLNLKQSGVRNTDATVMTEASCVVLRYPDAHVRVTLA